MESLTTTININVDSKTKQEATKILNDLGLNMTSAINMFLRQIIKKNGIPFEITNSTFSKELIEALEEAKKIRKDPERKGYKTVDELIDSLNED